MAPSESTTGAGAVAQRGGGAARIGYSYFTKKDYSNALPTARRGVQFRSPLLAQFYVLIGDNLDELGKRSVI
jgi:hypothetical protein